MAHPASRRTGLFLSAVSLALLVLAVALPWGRSVRGADHREAPLISLDPAADIADVFAFRSPVDPSFVVFAMTVNGFAVPGVRGSYSFDPDVLYQIKIDNTGDAREDLVIQISFAGFETDRDPRCPSGPGGQYVTVRGPAKPVKTGALNQPLQRKAPEVTGCTNQVLTGSGRAAGITAFAGLRDDPFVTDPAQLNRILGGTEQVFRDVTSSPLGPLDGRPVDGSGRSGFDTFGGFNVSAIAVEVPRSMVVGTRSRSGTYLGNDTTIGVWGTTSRQQNFHLSKNEDKDFGSGQFLQKQRAGQQLVKTVLIPSPLREQYNRSTPDKDLADLGTFSGPFGFSRFVPDTLTSNDPNGNTIAARAALLTALGVTALPNGAPLVPGLDMLVNTDLDLARKVIFPDVLRLDLDILPPNDLVLLNNGLQNGRRLDDDVTDILLRGGRQLFDVRFPAGSGVPGADSPPDSRRALDCTTLPNCPDRRVLAVLQGTDFIEPDADVADVSTSGQDRPLLPVFPFFGEPHPLPGNPTPAPGTVGYPPSPGND